MPKGDLVLAKVAEAEEKTSGGILLPGSAQVGKAWLGGWRASERRTLLLVLAVAPAP